jgi:hypothetical protein
MKKSISLYAFLILALSIGSNAVFAIPTLTEASTTGTTVKFTTKLSEKLPTGYKVKIDLNNGKGLVAMTCSGLTCSLSSNALPKLDSPTYKIGIYDSKGVMKGELLNGTYTNSFLVTASGYSKISNSGAVLPDNATLGGGANDWACTKDNRTGLIWEVKTADGGLRAWDKIYTNYFVRDVGYGATGNADVFVSAVNKQTLCGASDWRLPKVDELQKLFLCSDGKYETNGYCTNDKTVIQPTINTVYFPNTQSDTYWSSSVIEDDIVWFVYFDHGYSDYDGKYFKIFVRLVR